MEDDSKLIHDLLRSLEENSDQAIIEDESSIESFSDFDFLKGRVINPEKEPEEALEETISEKKLPEPFPVEDLYQQGLEEVLQPAEEDPPLSEEVPPLLDDPFEIVPKSVKSGGQTEEDVSEKENQELSEQPEEIFGGSPWDFQTQGGDKGFSQGKLMGSSVYLGLDIGHRATKYVLARKKRGDRVIQAFGILNYPEGMDFDYKKIADRLLELLKQKNLLKSAKINLVIYDSDMGIQRISLPILKKKELTEAITWFLKKKFEFQEKSVLTDSLHVGKKKVKGVDHVDILGAIAPEDVIEDHIEPFLNQKIVPSALTPLPSVLLSLYRAAHLENQGDCVAMVDFGAEKTMIAFIRDNNLEFARMVPIGGDQITEGMTSTIFHEGHAFQLDPAEAERIKREYGFPIPGKMQEQVEDIPISEVGALMRPYLERLASEIQRSIDYYRENYSVEQIDQVYLLGGSAGMKNLLDFLRAEIDERLELFRFSMHFPLNLPSPEAQAFHNRFLELAVAVGLAMGSKKSLNMLPAQFRKLELFKLQRRVLVYISLFVLTGLIFISATSFLRVASLKNEYLQLQLEYKKMLPRKHRYDVLLAEKQFLTRKKQIYQSQLILDNPLPQILKMISNLFPPDMALTALSISHESMEIGGVNQNAKKSGGKKNKDKKVELSSPISYLHLHGVRYHPPPDEGIKLANFMLKLDQTGYFRHVSLLNQSFSEEKDEMRFEIVCEF